MLGATRAPEGEDDVKGQACLVCKRNDLRLEGRIGRGAEGEPNRAKEGGDGEVSEKLLEHEAIAGFPVHGRGRASPFVGRGRRSGGQG